MFFDLQNAFDSLDHRILFSKLSNYGFRGPFYNTMVDYVSCGLHYVFANGIKSNIAKLTTRVPQESVLGPYLFLTYIIDLPRTLDSNNKISCFADETSNSKSGKGNCNMQNDLDKHCDWLNYNKLSLNTSKCETMSCGSTHQNTLAIHNEPISRRTCSKCLGVSMDFKLTFRDHINHVAKKFIKFCGLIYKVSDIHSINCLLSFYNAYARSVNCYGLLLYGSAAKTNLCIFEMAQRQNIRAITFKRKFGNSQNILRETELNTVFELLILDVSGNFLSVEI